MKNILLAGILLLIGLNAIAQDQVLLKKTKEILEGQVEKISWNYIFFKMPEGYLKEVNVLDVDSFYLAQEDRRQVFSKVLYDLLPKMAKKRLVPHVPSKPSIEMAYNGIEVLHKRMDRLEEEVSRAGRMGKVAGKLFVITTLLGAGSVANILLKGDLAVSKAAGILSGVSFLAAGFVLIESNYILAGVGAEGISVKIKF